MSARARRTLALAGLLFSLLLAFGLRGVELGAGPASASKPAPTKAASAAAGARQAAKHTAAVSTPPIVPFIHTLHRAQPGCPCPTVFQLQRALKAAHVRPAASRSTGYYGKGTALQVAAFQRTVKIAPSGIYGSKTHHALSKFYDKVGRARLIAVAHSRRIVAITTAIKTVTTHAALVGGSTLAYSQSSSRGILPQYPGVPPATDCSGYVTWVYKSVGLPDPNGWNFNPVGWTGTLGQHGVVVRATQARVGDLALYGGGFPFGHVAIVVHIHPTLVSSHGEPGIHVLPISYRPLSQLRRYF